MTDLQILVVNDEESIREVVATMLNQAGYQDPSAAPGMEALELLDAARTSD